MRRWREFSVSEKAIGPLEACTACESVWVPYAICPLRLGLVCRLGRRAGSCLPTKAGVLRPGRLLAAGACWERSLVRGGRKEADGT